MRGIKIGRTRGLERVGRSTEIVCDDTRYRRRLAGSICGVPSGSVQLSCRIAVERHRQRVQKY